MPSTIRDDIKQRRPFASPAQEAAVALFRTASDVARHIDAVIARKDLTQPQYNALRILRGADAPMPTMEVAGRMVTPMPGITRLIDRLEKAGLVERVSCADDRRRTLCTITENGRSMLEELDPHVNAAAEEAMRRLGSSQLAAFLDTLDEVREGVRTTAGELASP